MCDITHIDPSLFFSAPLKFPILVTDKIRTIHLALFRQASATADFVGDKIENYGRHDQF